MNQTERIEAAINLLENTAGTYAEVRLRYSEALILLKQSLPVEQAKRAIELNETEAALWIQQCQSSSKCEYLPEGQRCGFLLSIANALNKRLQDLTPPAPAADDCVQRRDNCERFKNSQCCPLVADEREGKLVYSLICDKQKERPHDDIPEAYEVYEHPEASNGIVIYARYHGKWHANPWSKRELVKALIGQLAAKDQWISDLQSGMYVNCVYCGHRYGPKETTPVSMANALKKHIEQCPEHPMSKLKSETDERFKQEIYRVFGADGYAKWLKERSR